MARLDVRLRIIPWAALAMGAAVGAAAIGARELHAATPPVKTTTVKVVMTEYRFKLTPKVVPVGNVIFKIVNAGEVPHNMVFQGPILYKSSRLLQHGQTSTMKIRVKTPGPYHFVCTLHFKLGMVGSFTAKKA